MQNNVKSKCKPVVVVLSLMFAGAALADSTSDHLSKIEAETMLLKAREKQLTVQAQIAAKQMEIASKQAESGHLAGIANAGDPVIRSVEGIGKTLYATLQLSNGSTIEAKADDVLPNGMRVLSIKHNEVIVETSRKTRVRLGTGTSAAAPYTPGQSGTSAALPPLPVPSRQGFAK